MHLDEELALGELGCDASVAVRRVQHRQDLRDDRLVDRDDVAVAEREHRVEVHGGAVARHLRSDHEPGGTGREQALRENAHGPRVRALALADEQDAVADGHHVAALERRAAPSRSTPPNQIGKSALRKRGWKR